jgi:hypothetical protein
MTFTSVDVVVVVVVAAGAVVVVAAVVVAVAVVLLLMLLLFLLLLFRQRWRRTCDKGTVYLVYNITITRRNFCSARACPCAAAWL